MILSKTKRDLRRGQDISSNVTLTLIDSSGSESEFRDCSTVRIT